MKLPDLVQPSEAIVKSEDITNFHKNWASNYYIVVDSAKYMDCVIASIYLITVWGKGTDGLEDG